MKRFHGIRTFAMLFFPLIAVEMVSAAPADPKLLSLVPPGSQLVAGVSYGTPTGHLERLLVIGRKNLVDRCDFISLAGVDDSKVIRQMIFVAGGSDPSTWGEHGILVTGRFDQARIFKAAVSNGATVTEFRGFRVLVQQPFERELGTFKDVRWLVVIDSKVALFGTRFSIQQELNRYLDGSAVDPLLMQKVSRLRPDDATWSVVLGVFNADDQLEHVFRSLDPALANLIRDRTPFQFGIRYGRKVEVEYEVTVPSGASPQAISNFSTQPVVAGNNGSSLSPRLDLTADRAPVHGVVKVTTKHYEEWLDECARTAVSKSGN